MMNETSTLRTHTISNTPIMKTRKPRVKFTPVELLSTLFTPHLSQFDRISELRVVHVDVALRRRDGAVTSKLGENAHRD